MPSTSYPHYAWAAGHFAVLLGTALTFLGRGAKTYKIAYFGALVSWGIVVYKSLGAPQVNRAYLQRALLDENVQYLLLALYWFLQKPIYITLIPFATFSLFHALTFIRTSVLPKPPAVQKPATGSGQAQQAQQQAVSAGAQASKVIQTWVKANYEKAMLFVAFVEVVLVFGRVLLGAITFQNSLLAPLFFAHFLRLRYYLSPPTRQAFKWVSDRVDQYTVQNPKCPPAVGKAVKVVRELFGIERREGSRTEVGRRSDGGSGTGMDKDFGRRKLSGSGSRQAD
ncbi:hypothetical protein BMF94_4030 [Rhodotorula taiwanensis]|uniref:Endoplasmic reticulum protein n=1 Tax=Rhodotorula taiwanensis TaxID=741276 RepID=A0A2S5B845_9BASI|nr:hypothetical protein BMF94_4030 [Rhodotorula taiwanensis]